MRRNGLFKRFFNIFNDIKFKGLNLSNSEKFIFFGWLFTLISLFFPWVIEKGSDSLGDEKLFYGFNEKIGNPGIIISVILLIIIFNLFSKQKKEKIKLYSNFHFNNNSVYVNTGILISVVSIICLNFISGLKWYSSSIEGGNGSVICLTGGVAILLGGLFNRKNNEKLNTYINDIDDDLNQNVDKTKNMKLPF